MAHLIDLSNHRANIAYVGETPWHGLGTELESDAPLDTWRIAAGLAFDYQLAPVQYLGDQTFPGRQVVFRSDTLVPLSVVSERYHAVQPNQVLEFFRDLAAEHGFRMETAGSLKDGALVWALAKTGRDFALGGDALRQYVLLMTSCDASLATRATLTSVRVVCMNTLSAALRMEQANLVVTRHSTQFDARAVKRNLGLVDDTWSEFADAAERMATKRLADLDMKEAVLQLFGNPAAPADHQPNLRAMNKVIDLFNGEGRGSSLPSARHSAWGLLHAVTEYVDHHVPERKHGARLASAWTGRGEILKRRALDTCLKLAA
jgi:phage/plasmid-like protein (TIGR03299 family)